MKTLILVRHAKSSWDDPSLSDFDRPLNERGNRDAPRMGKRLNEKGVIPGLMLSSPANRALATCKIIAENIGYPVSSIQTNKNLYHASEEELLMVVRKLPDQVDIVMLFGHNPGLTDFANNLTKSRVDNIPTCGVLCCNFDVEEWSKVTWGKGKVKFFDFPKKPD